MPTDPFEPVDSDTVDSEPIESEPVESKPVESEPEEAEDRPDRTEPADTGEGLPATDTSASREIVEARQPWERPRSEEEEEAEIAEEAEVPPFAVAGTPQPRPRRWINYLLFALTLATTSYWGFLEYQSFYQDELGAVVWNPLNAPGRFLGGLPYGLAVIAFLLAHEMGHYLACRYYGLRATFPYFIPVPPLIAGILPGTMGAVIRILSPIRYRRALFDIAVAGPIAGFLVALPILAVGIAQSRVIPSAAGPGYLQMGEPLIWGPMEALFDPAMTANQDLLAHPLAFVGWFALLVTAMNLLPVGQLDGGHVLYAFLPRHHRWISVTVIVAMLLAGWFFFPGWIVFALVIFFLLGTRHPPLQTFEGLGTARWLLALASLLIFASSFTLVPITLPPL